MNTNLGPVALLEKLISEHGSVVTLKESLELVKENYTTLERKVSELESKTQGLLRENESLKSQLAAQEKLIKKENSHHEEMRNRPEPEQSILLFLAQNGSSAIEVIAKHIGKSPDATKFHLEELEEARLTRSGVDQSRASYYLIDQGGRRYLHQRGLLK